MGRRGVPACAALAAQAAAEHAEYEQLRQRLGLPGTPRAHGSSAQPASGAPLPPPPPPPASSSGRALDVDVPDPEAALAHLGKQLCVTGQAVPPPGGGPQQDAQYAEVARRHLAGLAPAQLALR